MPEPLRRDKETALRHGFKLHTMRRYWIWGLEFGSALFFGPEGNSCAGKSLKRRTTSELQP